MPMIAVMPAAAATSTKTRELPLDGASSVSPVLSDLTPKAIARLEIGGAASGTASPVSVTALDCGAGSNAGTSSPLPAVVPATL